MTMLDRMRRHKGWLKWSLAIVCATFVLLYVPQFLDPTGTGAGAAPRDVVAIVEGRPILAATYESVYVQQMAQLRQAYGEITDQVAQQLGFGQRIIQQLIGQEAQLAEAERLGLAVTDGELRERLIRLPAFQENGVFIGDARYRDILASARPPVRPVQFQEDLRRSLLAEKLQNTVAGWITVSDDDVEEAYRRIHERVRLDLAVFSPDRFRSGVTVTDAEITGEYEANPDPFRVDEKRRARYLALDVSTLRTSVSVTTEEVEQRYQDNLTAFASPEQTRASHILFSTQEPATDVDEVRKRAEEVLARVKNGEDFAALAREYSDDPSSAEGGDLNFFARGAMVPAFDEAAWRLQPGETTDELVETEFGFHIIRVTDRRPAETRTLEQVRAQLEDQIRNEKARGEADRLATALDDEISAPADLDRLAAEHNLTVRDSGLFARDEPLAGLGIEPTVAAEVFRLEQDQVSDAVPTAQGYAFLAVVEIQAEHLPALDDIRDQVREAVVERKAVDLARARATTVANASNFAAAARAAGVTVQSTDLITRGAALPEIGVSDRVDRAAFALSAGETTAPIDTERGVVVAHVREKQDIVPEGLESQRETLRDQLTNERRQEFFSAYMTKAMENMDISYNDRTIAALLGM